jgi:hypothetical protein
MVATAVVPAAGEELPLPAAGISAEGVRRTAQAQGVGSEAWAAGRVPALPVAPAEAEREPAPAGVPVRSQSEARVLEPGAARAARWAP